MDGARTVRHCLPKVAIAKGEVVIRDSHNHLLPGETIRHPGYSVGTNYSNEAAAHLHHHSVAGCVCFARPRPLLWRAQPCAQNRCALRSHCPSLCQARHNLRLQLERLLKKLCSRRCWNRMDKCFTQLTGGATSCKISTDQTCQIFRLIHSAYND